MKYAVLKHRYVFDMDMSFAIDKEGV